MIDWVSMGVKCLQVNPHHQQKPGDRRLTKDAPVTCVSAGRAIFIPFDFKPLSPEYVIGGSLVAIFFLGNPSVIIIIIIMIVLLVVSWVTVFTFTVCFHRLSSLLHHKNTQNSSLNTKPISYLFCINNVFSYSPFSILQ